MVVRFLAFRGLNLALKVLGDANVGRFIRCDRHSTYWMKLTHFIRPYFVLKLSEPSLFLFSFNIFRFFYCMWIRLPHLMSSSYGRTCSAPSWEQFIWFIHVEWNSRSISTWSELWRKWNFTAFQPFGNKRGGEYASCDNAICFHSTTSLAASV